MLMNSVLPASRPAWHENLRFSQTPNVTNAKLCLMVLVTERYLFISFSETLTFSKGHGIVKVFD